LKPSNAITEGANKTAAIPPKIWAPKKESFLC
jgi:hypothetical protein